MRTGRLRPVACAGDRPFLRLEHLEPRLLLSNGFGDVWELVSAGVLDGIPGAVFLQGTSESKPTLADIDADGDLDVLITQNGRRPALLRNDQATGHHWLRVVLIGRPPATSAIGARLTLAGPDWTRQREVIPSRGYLSQVERTVTFGLGDLDDPSALSLTIDWPDGTQQLVRPEQLDTVLRVEQPMSQ